MSARSRTRVLLQHAKRTSTSPRHSAIRANLRHASSSAGSSGGIGLSQFVAGIAATTLGIAIYNNLPLASAEAKGSSNRPKKVTADSFDKAKTEIKSLLPEDCYSEDPDHLYSHGTTEWSYHDSATLPGLILYPRSAEDVSGIVKIAAKHNIALVARSGGTSLEGHFNAPETSSNPSSGGTTSEPKPGFAFTIDFAENMNKVVAVHARDLDVVVQPGISYDELNDILKADKLLFPVDPGPGAQIGGMIGCNASGTNAVRYGVMRDNVLNLTVVLPSGEIIKTRSRAKKSSAAPDLGKLFCGSEGTLGLVVEATLKVVPLLPHSVAVSSFPSIEAAADAVTEVIQSGIQVQCVELLDSLMIKMINAGNSTGRQWQESPAIFFKFQGDEQQIDHDIKKTASLVKNHQGTKLVFAKNDAEKADIWQSRKVALWSALAYVPGSRCITTDVCVPISNFPQVIKETQADLNEIGLPAPICAHSGDGNFHALILYTNEEEKSKAKGAVRRMVERAQKADGTCTGEHGVGIGKRDYLEAELGLGTIQLLRSIKKTIDPLNIMNPGKILPDEID